MTIQFIVGVLNGEVIGTVNDLYMSANQCEDHFPLGEVYMYAKEPQGMQWRVLQRRGGGTKQQVRRFSMLLPSQPEQVPEIVRMVALMRG